MSDKDNIISTSVSEAVMKIPTDEGIPMFLLCTAIADKEQTNI